jgi:AcrR family transcriptional regulator
VTSSSQSEQSPDPPRWQRRPASRPGEILEAGFIVFAEMGYERATIADVARRARVSPGLVVHYFGTKGELFEAVIHDRFTRFVEGEEALLAGHRGSYRDLLQQLLGRYWAFMWTPGSIELGLVVKAERAAFPECTRTLFQQLGQRWRRVVEGVLEAGAHQGEFRLSGPHPARVITAMLVGVAEASRCYGSFEARSSSPDELWGAITALLDHGLLAVPSSSGEPS